MKPAPHVPRQAAKRYRGRYAHDRVDRSAIRSPRTHVVLRGTIYMVVGGGGDGLRVGEGPGDSKGRGPGGHSVREGEHRSSSSIAPRGCNPTPDRPSCLPCPQNDPSDTVTPNGHSSPPTVLTTIHTTATPSGIPQSVVTPSSSPPPGEIALPSTANAIPEEGGLTPGCIQMPLVISAHALLKTRRPVLVLPASRLRSRLGACAHPGRLRKMR